MGNQSGRSTTRKSQSSEILECMKIDPATTKNTYRCNSSSSQLIRDANAMLAVNQNKSQWLVASETSDHHRPSLSSNSIESFISTEMSRSHTSINNSVTSITSHPDNDSDSRIISVLPKRSYTMHCSDFKKTQISCRIFKRKKDVNADYNRILTGFHEIQRSEPSLKSNNEIMKLGVPMLKSSVIFLKLKKMNKKSFSTGWLIDSKKDTIPSLPESPFKKNSLVGRSKHRKREKLNHLRSSLHSLSPSETLSSHYSMQKKTDQLLLVRKTWAHARNQGALEPAMSIFRHSFYKCGEIRALIMNGSRDAGYERLKNHAKSLTNIMDRLINGVETEVDAVEELRNAGRSHTSLLRENCKKFDSISNGESNGCPFRLAHFDHFASAMIERTLEWGEKKDRNMSTQIAWTKIVLFVVEQLKEGYKEAIRAERRARRQQQHQRNTLEVSNMTHETSSNDEQ